MGTQAYVISPFHESATGIPDPLPTQGTGVARELLPHDYGHSPFLLNGDYVLASPGRIPQRVRRFLYGPLMSPTPSPHLTRQDDGGIETAGGRIQWYVHHPNALTYEWNSRGIMKWPYRISFATQTSHHQCA